jgi:hypothetical protein
MALEGQLSDFNLAEIFQLIAGQKKCGILNLEAQPEMAFVFDKGILISTRDRRSEGPDHLERYLREYGFLDEGQWHHIEYIKNNACLDLTEILISEELMSEAEVSRVLRAVAQEMVFHGMKLTRGRYHFCATRGTPQGVRGRITMDIQGLLMEAARRLDEEPRLQEFLPSPAVTFKRGQHAPSRDDLSPVALHLLKLALTGIPLSKIIRQGRVDEITARQTLAELCEEGYVERLLPGQEATVRPSEPGPIKEPESVRGLRSTTLVVAVVTGLLICGSVRWRPVATAPLAGWGLGAAEMALGGGASALPLPQREAAAAGSSAVGAEVGGPAVGSWLDRIGGAPRPEDGLTPVLDLRLRQIRYEVVQALGLFDYRHGRYPADLSLLVKEGLLARATWVLVAQQKWSYELQDGGQTYSLTT